METRQGSVGKAIAGVEIRIADDGEILLRGENVTPGYYGEGASTALDAEGWFHTGDIGSKDAEGRLTILGRKKEMIVSPDGLNVYPQDVERALLASLALPTRPSLSFKAASTRVLILLRRSERR